MIVGFTGTQVGMSKKQLASVRETLLNIKNKNNRKNLEFHHGDCIGADSEAHMIALELGYRIVVHPPEFASKRAFCQGAYKVLDRKPYLERNHDIVLDCDLLIAAPAQSAEVIRSGTWATIRFARKLERQLILVQP